MKAWIKRTLIGLFGASILVGGLAACSSHRTHGWGGSQASAENAAKWRERVLERAAAELQLDEAQKQRLGVVFDKMREQRTALVGTTPPRDEIKALVSGERFDKARAQALIDEKTNALRAGSPQTITALAEFYDSLKPEQQQKVRDFMNKRRGWRS